MADQKLDFAALYARFRSSKNFLLALMVFVVTWMTLHFTLNHFDVDLGDYNSILSTEASLATTFLTLMFERQSGEQQREAQFTQQILERLDRQDSALLAMAEAQRDILADNTKLLKSMRAQDERVLKALEEVLEQAFGEEEGPTCTPTAS